MIGAALVLLLVVASAGCVALPSVGLAALSGGASTAVRAGTEHTLGGAAHRTFAASLPEVRGALLRTFEELQIKVTEHDMDGDTERIVAEALHREIGAHLEPITPALTQIRLVVRQGLLGRDRSTAHELLARAGHHLDVRTAETARPAP